MTTPTLKLYPSAPFENNDLEEGLEKKWTMYTVLITQLSTLKKWLLTSKMKNINEKRNNKKSKCLLQK